MSTMQLFGRENVLERLHELMHAGARFVTLTGPGGIGKTAVAKALCRLTRLGGWTGFVELDGAAVLGDLFDRVADALGVSPGLDTDAAIVEALRARGPGLIVLDEFERLPPEGAQAVERWLLLVPGLVVVVTSRIDLGCAAEHRFELEPLAPDAATALFRARAGARHASRRSEDDSGWARLIAESLHGVPLAIELAAGRTLVSSPREIADSLRRPRGVAELGADQGSVQSLRSVFERSRQLLPEWARAPLLDLVVFRGPFSLSAARAVALPEMGRREAERTVTLWRRHSMLAAADEPDSEERRFRMLAPVREVAAEIAPEGRLARARERHRAYYASRACEVGPTTPRSQLRSLEAERLELLGAHEASLDRHPQDALRLAVALMQSLSAQATFSEQLRWLGSTRQRTRRARGIEPGLRLGFDVTFAGALRRAGHYGDAERLLASRLRRDRAGPWHPHALQLLGRLQFIAGEEARARRTLCLALSAARSANDLLAIVRALRDLGDVERSAGRCREALVHAMAHGDPAEEAAVRWCLGRQLRYESRFDESLSELEAASRLAERAPDAYLAALAVSTRAFTEVAAGLEQRALESAAEGCRRFRAMGNAAMARATALDTAACLCLLGRNRMAETRLEELRAEARAACDEAVETSASVLLALSLGTSDPASGRKLLSELPSALGGDAAAARARGIAARALSIPGGPELDTTRLRLESPYIAAVQALVTRVADHFEGLRGLRSGAPSLSCAPRGEQFAVGDGPARRLGGPPSAILACLVAQHRARRGRPASRETLLEAGWPGERMTARSASLRLRNAIAQLRASGLRGLISTQGSGYLLDPDVEVATLLHPGEFAPPVVAADEAARQGMTHAPPHRRRRSPPSHSPRM
jgi:predicted ATPase/DNA-binding winged helix-turn-helix (wHTH) protein